MIWKTCYPVERIWTIRIFSFNFSRNPSPSIDHVLKLRNEVKVGIFAVIAIALFYTGMKYLKGSRMFGSPLILYAEYDDVKGLIPTNPIMLNGVRVGKVGDLDLNLERKIVRTTLEFHKDINLPRNYQAMIYSSDLLGSKAIKLVPRDSLPLSGFYKYGNDIDGIHEASLLQDLSGSGNDLMLRVTSLVGSLNETVNTLNTALTNPEGRYAINTILDNMKASSYEVRGVSHKIDSLTNVFLALAENTNGVVSAINESSGDIKGIISNTKVTTDSLTEAIKDVRLMTKDIRSAVGSMESTLAKIDNPEGTLGMLINDKELYDNLASSTANLNALVEDIQARPFRFFDDVKFYMFERRPPKEKKKNTEAARKAMPRGGDTPGN